MGIGCAEGLVLLVLSYGLWGTKLGGWGTDCAPQGLGGGQGPQGLGL